MTIIDPYAKEFKAFYDPIADDYNPAGHGRGKFAETQLWFGSFCQVAHEYFTGGVTILDYGSGPCGLVNFVSTLLEEFTYYGLEPQSPYGTSRIQEATDALGHDPRVNCGFLDTPLESEALLNADVIILGSIFTHLVYEDFMAVMDKLLPCVRSGGLVVFSIFIGDTYALGNGNSYDVEDTRTYAIFTQKQFDDYFAQYKDIQPVYGGVFKGADNFSHLLYRVEQC